MFRFDDYVVSLYTKSLYDVVVKPALDYVLIRRNRGKYFGLPPLLWRSALLSLIILYTIAPDISTNILHEFVPDILEKLYIVPYIAI